MASFSYPLAVYFTNFVFTSVLVSISAQNISPATCPSSASVDCLLSARLIPGTAAVPSFIPPWANLTLFTIGQDFAKKNIGYVGVSHYSALIFEQFIPDIRDVLYTTGSSRPWERAIRRYTATATQITLWYHNHPNNPIQRDILFRSLNMVRRLHLDAALKVKLKIGANPDFFESTREEAFQEIWNSQKNMKFNIKGSIIFDERFWEAMENDLISSDIPTEQRSYPSGNNFNETEPLSQFSFSLTQFSFAGIMILFHKELGATPNVSEEELQGFAHLWAVLGYAIGIKDEWNVCLNNSYEEMILRFRNIYENFFVPSLFQFSWRMRVQLGSYLDTLLQMDPVLTPKLMIYRFLTDVVKIQPKNVFEQLSPMERKGTAGADAVLETNLKANRFLVNHAGRHLLEFNGFKHYGLGFSTNDSQSRDVYYWKDPLLI